MPIDTLEAALEQERGRLVQAESVLVCLHAALLYSERAKDPDFAGVADIALNLVRRAADLLDRVSLQRVLGSAMRPRRPARAVRHSGKTKAVFE